MTATTPRSTASASSTARSDSTAAAPVARPGRLRAVLLVAAAAAVAIVADTVIGVAAVAAGADPDFPALRVVAIAPSAIVGAAAAAIGWASVVRRVADPASTLRVLVPVLTLLSFVPDVVLAFTRFIPGATTTGVIGLALMHVVTVAVLVPTLQRAIPARRR